MACYCKECEDEFSNLGDMVRSNCRATGRQEKHEPF